MFTLQIQHKTIIKDWGWVIFIKKMHIQWDLVFPYFSEKVEHSNLFSFKYWSHYVSSLTSTRNLCFTILEKCYIPNQSAICVLCSCVLYSKKNWFFSVYEAQSKIYDFPKFISCIHIFSLIFFTEHPYGFCSIDLTLSNMLATIHM